MQGKNLKPTDKQLQENSQSVEIQPVSFRTGRGSRSPNPTARFRWLITAVLATVLILLGISTWFVFTARQVVIQIDPEPQRIIIEGGLAAPKIGAHYLLRPGGYTLRAEKKCFQPLDKQFVVADEKSQQLSFSLSKLPGRLSIRAHRADRPSLQLEGAQVFVDGRPVGQTPIDELAVEPGRRTLEIRAEKYQDVHRQLQVEGCNAQQKHDLALVPGWSDITLASDPPGAAVRVDEKGAGHTPLTLELVAGDHDLEVKLNGFKPWRIRLTVAANQPRVLEPIQLQPADGTLKVHTVPPGASVMLENSFAGKTPLALALLADKIHRIRLSKAGYENATRTATVASGASKTLTVKLKPKLGIIELVVEPADAEMIVDGKSVGKLPRQLRLVAVEHQLEIREKGYRPYRTRITPRPGFVQQIKVTLSRQTSGKNATAQIIKAQNGYPLRLIRPHGFTMGASRREQGRRSNETLRRIELKRPFYMGMREVINRELRQFYAAHNAGVFGRYSLNGDQQPAVRVSWNLAARFCNWLSVKEGLTPFYALVGTTQVAAEPVGNGYRLPTEAEWEYCARMDKTKKMLKYPWGNKFPSAPRSGNFGDKSAADLLKVYLSDYNDGYPVTAPPEKFSANTLGLFDMGGNVAEWCHDYYAIYPHEAGRQYVDPLGPGQGKYHVVRGSSWQSADISTLRLAYRDYSDGKRPDLGFRICRYMK
jgi:formylglycine-generating enzyme required for sulfatase activity